MKKYVRAQIAAAILASASAPAMAGDVMPYIEGFGGYAIGSRSGAGDIVDGAGFGGDFGSSATYGGGIGVKLPYGDNTGVAFRFDLTGSSIPSLGGSNHTGTLDDGTPVSAKVKVNAVSYLATAYIDVDVGPVTPYVGFGLGGVQKRLSALTYSNPAGDFATVNGGNHNDFAWSGTVGVSYSVIPEVQVDFSYRYIDAGKVVAGTNFTDLTNGTTQTLDSEMSSRLQIHQFTAALRYLF